MKTMWMLVKDHLRRNWQMPAIYALALACFGLFIFSEPSYAPAGEHPMPHWALYFWAFAFMNSLELVGDNRVWRMLPVGKGTLATLQWRVVVWAAPALSFLIIAPLQLFTWSVGWSDAQSLTWTLLFLLFLTLLGGTMAFLRSLSGLKQARSEAAQTRQGIAPHRKVWTVKTILEQMCGIGAVLLMLVPTPSYWFDLKAGNVVGMCLAAWLTWRSYQMRYWLLEPARFQPCHTRKVSVPQGAPRYPRSVSVALRQDLTLRIRGTVIGVFAILGVCFLLPFLSASSVPALAVDRVFDAGTRVAVFLLIVGTAGALIVQFESIQMLGTLRSLPLTSRQCTLMLLLYPLTVSLIAVPCAVLFLWYAGYGPFFALLLAGLLLVGGLCPFGMLVLLDQGHRAFMGLTVIACVCIAIGGGILSAAKVQIPLSPPVLCAIAAVMAFFGIKAYYGLRRLIETNSGVYKPEPPLPLFGQKAER